MSAATGSSVEGSRHVHSTVSADGTTIAFETLGAGSPLVLVDGALCHRGSGPARPLAEHLMDRFSVAIYDRRGRGNSGDTATYSVDREVEDLTAVIEAVGGAAGVYGISSGAALALEAAHRGAPITRLAVYEAPFIIDDSGPPEPTDYLEKLEGDLAAGRRGAAVRRFLRLVGVPAFGAVLMGLMPGWSKLKAVAHTLPYDHAILTHARGRVPLPPDRYAGATMPSLSMAGGKSPAYLANAMQHIADLLPTGQYRTIAGQTHMLKAKAIAPVLAEFFSVE